MKILFLILVITFCSNAYALKIPAPPIDGTFTLNNDVYFSHKGGISKIYPDVSNNITSLKPYTIPTSKGNFPLTLERNLPVAVGRLGKAATTLIKRLGPLATGLTLLDVTCDLTDICVNPLSPLEFSKKSNNFVPTPLYPTSVTGFSFRLSNPNFPPYTDNNRFPTIAAACSAAGKDSILNYDVNGGNAIATCYNVPLASNTTLPRVYNDINCASNYSRFNLDTCVHDVPSSPVYTPVVPDDWLVAEPKLNDSRVSIPLLDAGGDLPVDAPILTPKEQIISKTTETVRDQTGTAIGNKTTETTVKVSPAIEPNQFDVTEKSVVNVTNLTNNTSNTTTITNETPADLPPTEPDKTDIEFDSIPDVALNHYDIPSISPSSSFGESTCLPDPIFTISKGTFTLPFHVACQFAAMCKFIILLLSTLTAAFIITGAKNATP